MPLVHHDTKNLTKSASAGLSKMLHDAMASLMARFRGDGASVKGAGWTDWRVPARRHPRRRCRAGQPRCKRTPHSRPRLAEMHVRRMPAP